MVYVCSAETVRREGGSMYVCMQLGVLVPVPHGLLFFPHCDFSLCCDQPSLTELRDRRFQPGEQKRMRWRSEVALIGGGTTRRS